ncbi:MAG: hypothetical protein IT209_09910 [Armatimonadetes bacterium]|nr:hypothetical protein [Armatimonadota bacterium]
MTQTASAIPALEEQLNSFDGKARHDALIQLRKLADEGGFALPSLKDETNAHMHSFYSYNALGWSPSRIAWESRKYGLEVAGKVEFDVLDGTEEFLSAGEILGLKTVCSLETRVFIREYADKVINSPGEPGIAYFMTAGVYRLPEAQAEAANTAKTLYTIARTRNEELMERVNAHLAPVTLDYRRDVLPLTPQENATERHLLAAYDAKARETYPQPDELARYWSQKLGVEQSQARSLVDNPVKLQETMRAKLMKKGGVAYVQPDSGSFPSVETVIRFAQEIGAIPCATWLDGTNPGEDNMLEMLSLLQSKGVAMANIIPDRNWRIADPEEKALKLRKLEEMVQACRALDMPVIAGTEMNKLGQPFVDDFAAPELQPYAQDFMDGAHFLWGHTLLARYADCGSHSLPMQRAFGDRHDAKNRFFARMGELPLRPVEEMRRLRELEPEPERLYNWLRAH